MWNEHCSYKSSRLHLKTLPTTGPCVIQGPGENAGVIDIGDGLAAVFKMESHNHPSFIEPYQGATTGVGGILRDVFTMGARPIACMNALSFGAPDHPRTRHLVSGVVAGVGGYGNSFGVPTVGGSVRFHPRYDGNILVNAFALGLAETDRIFYAKATGVGNPIVYLGSKTGRDGIHGATMASAEFDDQSEEKRPTVQVGDPFAEKLLLEACLELMATDAIIAIQDMGAAGLTCSAVEMGAKGDLGVELDLDKVPVRETGMSAYEMMLSESQERMLMVLKPGKEAEAEAIFDKWGLDFADRRPYHRTICASASCTAARSRPTCRSRSSATRRRSMTGRMCRRRRARRSPRPTSRPPCRRRGAEAAGRLARSLLQALGVGAVRPPDPGQHGRAAGRRRRRGPRPGRAEGPRHDVRRDASLLRGRSLRGRQAGRGRGLAQPHRRRRDAARRHRQSQFRQSGAARDHGPARRLPSRASARPAGRSTSRSSRAMSRSTTRPTAAGILPTPTIGGVGLVDDVAQGRDDRVQGRRRDDHPDRRNERLARPVGWLAEIAGREDGPPPPVDLAVEKRNGDFVRAPHPSGKMVTACHDVSDGGVLVALAEMAMASGIGLRLIGPRRRHRAARLLVRRGSGPLRRYRARLTRRRRVVAAAREAGVPALVLGTTGGDALMLPDEAPILVADLKARHEGFHAGADGARPASVLGVASDSKRARGRVTRMPMQAVRYRGADQAVLPGRRASRSAISPAMATTMPPPSSPRRFAASRASSSTRWSMRR